jgi:hypothetical protein
MIDPGFLAAFMMEFDSLQQGRQVHRNAPRRVSEPLHGKELSVSFQIIIPTAPEGFSNARVAATQTCTYNPGEGKTLASRVAEGKRELEATRNMVLAEGEELRRALSTGTYLTTTRAGVAHSRSRR